MISMRVAQQERDGTSRPVGIAAGSAIVSALLAFVAPMSLARPLSVGQATVTPWRNGVISSGAFESHAAIDPRTGDFWLVRSTKAFTGWRIHLSRCAGLQLLPPREPPFAGKGLEADPAFSPDGRFLYYVSTRVSGSSRSRDLDIWRVDRGSGSMWSAPERLPAPVNSDEAEWFPRQSIDGWLYFGSSRPGGFGGNDIWRARQTQFSKWIVENAGPNINSAQDEYEPLPSPDGLTLIIEASDGYYISNLEHGTWSSRKRLGPHVNANGTEIGAVFSPSGKSVLFARDTGEPASGEFFLWHRGDVEAWPDICRPLKSTLTP